MRIRKIVSSFDEFSKLLDIVIHVGHFRRLSNLVPDPRACVLRRMGGASGDTVPRRKQCGIPAPTLAFPVSWFRGSSPGLPRCNRSICAGHHAARSRRRSEGLLTSTIRDPVMRNQCKSLPRSPMIVIGKRSKLIEALLQKERADHERAAETRGRA